MNDDKDYFAILENGFLMLVEITSERRQTINEKYNGDEQDYFEDVIGEELDLSFGDVQWQITSASQMFCVGESLTIPSTDEKVHD